MYFFLFLMFYWGIRSIHSSRGPFKNIQHHFWDYLCSVAIIALHVVFKRTLKSMLEKQIIDFLLSCCSKVMKLKYQKYPNNNKKKLFLPLCVLKLTWITIDSQHFTLLNLLSLYFIFLWHKKRQSRCFSKILSSKFFMFLCCECKKKNFFMNNNFFVSINFDQIYSLAFLRPQKMTLSNKKEKSLNLSRIWSTSCLILALYKICPQFQFQHLSFFLFSFSNDFVKIFLNEVKTFFLRVLWPLR
jgi:hypothetical protein